MLPPSDWCLVLPRAGVLFVAVLGGNSNSSTVIRVQLCASLIAFCVLAALGFFLPPCQLPVDQPMRFFPQARAVCVAQEHPLLSSSLSSDACRRLQQCAAFARARVHFHMAVLPLYRHTICWCWCRLLLPFSLTSHQVVRTCFMLSYTHSAGCPAFVLSTSLLCPRFLSPTCELLRRCAVQQVPPGTQRLS